MANQLKPLILERLNTLIEERVQEAHDEIASLNSSKANETKSSAGDKYETGMAMLQIEEEKFATQLTKAKELRQTLSMIDVKTKSKTVQLGSLVHTSSGLYFISIPFGKLELDGKEIFVLSISSPIGLLLKGKSVGETISFQSKEMKILSIL
jgi:hypothetical protein